MEILTNNKDGFYNFATVRISKLRSDIGSQYSDILSDWDELKQFVEEYCQYFEDDITNFLSEIDDKTPVNRRFTIYNNLYWYVFDEDDIKEDLRERTGNFENRTY